MAINTKYRDMYGVTTRTIQKGINFTSDAVTNAPVSKVYFNDKLVWAPYYSVTMSYPANTLNKIEYTRGFPGENGYEKSVLGIASSGTTITLKCMEGQVLLITPVPKSGYAVTSYHGKPITITGDMTITITTKAATKGKLSAPVLQSGFSGKVDSVFKAYGRFKNPNNVSVTATIRPYAVEDKALSQPTRDFGDKTATLTAGETSVLGVEGRPFDSYVNKTVIAVKFSASGYEDSDWRVWSDYTNLVNSTAYNTGQIQLALEENCVYYEDGDNDNDYDLEINLITTDHALEWPMVITSPLGIKKYWRATDTELYDVPPDNLKLTIYCYDPTGIFKPATITVTQSDLSEAPYSI